MYRRVGRGLFLSAIMLMLPAVVYGQAVDAVWGARGAPGPTIPELT